MLRDALRSNGVYVPKIKFQSIAKSLEIVVQEEEQAEWPQKELDKESLSENFNSWQNTQDPKAAEARQRVFSVVPVSQLIELRNRP